MNDIREQWLVIDSTITRLKRLSYWLTSLDPEKKHINNAIKELEQAKRLLEAK